MKYFSMFSGIGGFELGIQQAYESNIKCKHFGKESQSKECSQRGFRTINKHGKMLCPPDRSAPLCAGFSEIDKYAIQIYEKHFRHKNYGDATKIKTAELPDFDFLVGGFPCQAFSIAGKRKGFDDTRGTLFFEIARILRDKRPRHLLLENVKGLLSHESGKTFQTILEVLSDIGYRVEWQVLNSKDFGVPQNRERVFIVGHLRGECGEKIFPIRENDGGDNEEQLPGKEADEGGNQQNDKSRGGHTVPIPQGSQENRKIKEDGQADEKTEEQSHVQDKGQTYFFGEKVQDGISEERIERLENSFKTPQGRHLLPETKNRDFLRQLLLAQMSPPFQTAKNQQEVLASEARGEQAKRQEDRQEAEERKLDSHESVGASNKTWAWDDGASRKLMSLAEERSPTLKASRSNYMMLTKKMDIRRLTPIECERLQGFPDGWTKDVSDTQRYKTLGNAVTVNVIREVMKNFKCLEND